VHIIGHLLQKYFPNTALTNWHLHNQTFWELRNNYMTRQIIRMAETHKGEKIVVLTGLSHKHYLLDKLGEVNNVSYTLLPFPEDK
jgi:pheromone shutdown protein TraB